MPTANTQHVGPLTSSSNLLKLLGPRTPTAPPRSFRLVPPPEGFLLPFLPFLEEPPIVSPSVAGNAFTRDLASGARKQSDKQHSAHLRRHHRGSQSPHPHCQLRGKKGES